MVSDLNELGTSFSKENHMLLKTELHRTVLKSCTVFSGLSNQFLTVIPLCFINLNLLKVVQFPFL